MQRLPSLAPARRIGTIDHKRPFVAPPQLFYWLAFHGRPLGAKSNKEKPKYGGLIGL